MITLSTGGKKYGAKRHESWKMRWNPIQNSNSNRLDSIHVMDDAIDWYEDSIWMDGLQSTWSNPVQPAMLETKHSACVARYVKFLADTNPIDGHPAYDVNGPALAIANVHENESDFFSGPFGIWLDNDSNDGPQCRAI